MASRTLCFHSLKLSGQTESADKEAAKILCPVSKQEVNEEGYNLDSNFNTDENVLSQKQMPSKTYFKRASISHSLHIPEHSYVSISVKITSDVD